MSRTFLIECYVDHLITIINKKKIIDSHNSIHVTMHLLRRYFGGKGSQRIYIGPFKYFLRRSN